MQTDSAKEESLFVVGASAGGVEALERLISSLPADFGAPLVIAQHLDPTHPSRLEEVLHSKSALKLQTVSNGSAKLEPRTIYLVPSGHNVEVVDGTLGFSPKMRHTRPQPSIDLLFQTAAEAYGERLVAVILSGMGTDGAAGVRAVKEAGGTVVVQDPASAAYPALPASIAPALVDLVAPLDAMGPLLAGLAARRAIPEALHDEDVIRAFLTQLRGRSGIDFTQYKMPTILRRLSRLMAASGCGTIPEYMRYLNANADAYQRLVGSFLIKVTGFFRDPALFNYLREHALPEIIAHTRENGTEMRIWSAGCATGEEAYSIAMVLAELLGDEIDDMRIRIFATDLDPDAIAFARRGIYPKSALSTMTREMVKKYFTRIEDSYQVKKRIRNLTVFGEYDLGQRAPFPRIDLIFCRNVLIYFTKELQQRTLHLFAFSLREGGYLVLGKAETASPLPQYFTPVHAALKIYARHGDRLLIPRPTFIEGAPLPGRANVKRDVLPSVPREQRRIAEMTPRWSLSERLGSFLFHSPIGIVVVDRNYDIQSINQAGRGLLGIYAEGIGEDLIHLASAVPSRQLKGALDSAFGSESAGSDREVEVHDQVTNQLRYLQIGCYPDKSSTKDGRTIGAIVLVQDVTEAARHRRRLEAENGERQALNERLANQNEELQQRQRALAAANSDLTSANNDLRSTNEHLLIAAEEAEASAEEVETLNEEMQATTEELETLNEELQATIEELNTTNEELAARSSELERSVVERQEQLRRIEQQRRVYESTIAEMPAPVAIVAPDGNILGASNEYKQLASKVKTLRAVGQPWVEPNVSDVSVRNVPVDFDERPARLVILTPP